jgi:uncharacterized membrane protein HdeD (DUF308 family)
MAACSPLVAAPADRNRLADHHRGRAQILDRLSSHHRDPRRRRLPGGHGGRVPARLGAAELGWAHALLGVLFLGGAIWAFVDPFGTFWSLAAVVGLLLILQGGFVLISSIASREINGVWWLGMISGILEIIIGFWAAQQALPARAVLLVIWVGLFAMFRGLTDIVLAFELKGAQNR